MPESDSVDEWSDDETLRGDDLSISEMAAMLKRDYVDVRNKLAEIAQCCRSPRDPPT